jgi:hypothetical protein
MMPWDHPCGPAEGLNPRKSYLPGADLDGGIGFYFAETAQDLCINFPMN